MADEKECMKAKRLLLREFYKANCDATGSVLISLFNELVTNHDCTINGSENLYLYITSNKDGVYIKKFVCFHMNIGKTHIGDSTVNLYANRCLLYKTDK